MSAEIGDPAGSSATASKDSPLTPWGRRYFRLLDLCSIVFWLYVILKVFVFDFDTYLLQQLFPAHAWLLQLRLVFLLALLALALLVFDKSAVLLSCAYVVCFPLILVLWKIPRRIYKRQSWVLLFGLANAAYSFIAAFRYNVVIAAAILSSAAVILFASSKPLLWAGIAIILGALYSGYGHRFIAAVKPLSIFSLHSKVVTWLKNATTKDLVPDPATRGIPYSSLTQEQATKWTASLQNSVLASRMCLFVAKKLKRYQSSGVGFYSAAFVVLFVVLLTVIVFALANSALFKIDRGYFLSSEAPTFFTFIYYSFSTIVFQRLPELTPVATPSRILWMMEAASALFFALIFASVIVSARNQRQTDELNEAIGALSEQGKTMELFVLDQYRFATIDEALAELQRLKAGLVSFIVRISSDV